jgi:corrinoid protein of di/trimethylamine methyltransferase
MKGEKLFEFLKNAIVELNEEKAIQLAKDMISQGIDPLEGIEKGLSIGMKIIGDKFDKMEVYLPELIRAANTFNAVMKVLEPKITKKGKGKKISRTVVLGTVSGDIHKIGKDIVAMLMQVRGFDVHNLGEDVSITTFVNKAVDVDADIIGMSSLLTTTMPVQKEVIDLLKEKGIRDRFIIMVGGGPVSQEWAQECGADGYAETAEQAIILAEELIARRSEQ